MAHCVLVRPFRVLQDSLSEEVKEQLVSAMRLVRVCAFAPLFEQG